MPCSGPAEGSNRPEISVCGGQTAVETKKSKRLFLKRSSHPAFQTRADELKFDLGLKF
jgi:hypothetical protein